MGILEKILRTLSHDLRSPLGLAKNTAELLADTTENDELRGSLRMISQQSLLALDLVDNILCYGRMEEKKFFLMDRETAMDEIVPAIERNFFLLTGSAPEFSNSESLEGVKWKGDEYYLRLAVRNLVRSAMEAGGTSLGFSWLCSKNIFEVRVSNRTPFEWKRKEVTVYHAADAALAEDLLGKMQVRVDMESAGFKLSFPVVDGKQSDSKGRAA